MKSLYFALLKTPLILIAAIGVMTGIFFMRKGIKAQPMDIDMVLRGGLVMVLGIFCFPSRHHILYRLWCRFWPWRAAQAERARAAPQDMAEPEEAPVLPKATAGRKGQTVYQPTTRRLEDGRVRLDMILPPPDLHRATSWIGGLPKLPRGTDWPRTEEGPMLFVAQIAVADLPPEIWGGMGPSTGSLAFFVHADGDHRSVKVLPVEGVLEERAYPGPLEVIRAYPILRRGLAGELLAVPPDEGALPVMKWPVRITPMGPEEDLPHPSAKYRDRESLAVTHRQQVSLSDPAFVPYDWDSLIQFLTVLIQALNASIHKEGTKTSHPEPVKESQAQRNAAAGVLMEMRKTLAQRKRSGEAFSSQVWHLTRAQVEGLHVAWARKVGQSGDGSPLYALEEPRPVLEAMPWQRYYSAFEYLARARYLDAQSRLPDVVRASFEPVWKNDAAFEVAMMGGRADLAAYTAGVGQDMICLLELPFSELVGMVWHDMSSFAVFIDRQSLAEGRFDRAIGALAE